MQKPKILILSDFYLPGYKSGGAVRTLVSMIERMRDEFEFSVVTRNHDGWGDFEPYPEIKTDEWNLIDRERVFYFGREGLKRAKLKSLCAEIKPDAIFAVSFFSDLTTKALTLRRFKRLSNVPFVLAPQGELSAGALKIKAAKKRAFLAVTRSLGIYRNLIWKASADEEKRDIERVFGERNQIEIVPDLTPKIILPHYCFEQKPLKQAGAARFIFLSRVNRKKNLSHALRALQGIRGEIIFDVFGAHDDEIYWQECQELIKKLPPNIQVTVHGSIDYVDVLPAMREYHFFVLPTHNENFGHVVLEAMAAGCPVLLSENTPWRNLAAQKLGWDLRLENLDGWRETLQNCVEMSAPEFAEFSNSARKFAVEWLAAPEIEATNRELLRRAVKSTK